VNGNCAFTDIIMTPKPPGVSLENALRLLAVSSAFGSWAATCSSRALELELETLGSPARGWGVGGFWC